MRTEVARFLAVIIVEAPHPATANCFRSLFAQRGSVAGIDQSE